MALVVLVTLSTSWISLEHRHEHLSFHQRRPTSRTTINIKSTTNPSSPRPYTHTHTHTIIPVLITVLVTSRSTQYLVIINELSRRLPNVTQQNYKIQGNWATTTCDNLRRISLLLHLASIPEQYANDCMAVQSLSRQSSSSQSQPSSSVISCPSRPKRPRTTPLGYCPHLARAVMIRALCLL